MPEEAITNQPSAPIWPTLETASRISDAANFVLIGSLVAGVVATGLIVWMASVKETYWDRLREKSNTAIAYANAEAAKANEAAAEAQQKTAELRLALDQAVTERAPRHLSPAKKAELVKILGAAEIPKGKVVFNPLWTDGEAVSFSYELLAAFKEAGFEAVDANMGEKILSLNRLGIFLYVKDATHRPPHLNAVAAALKAIGLSPEGVIQEIEDPTAVYIIIGAHP